MWCANAVHVRPNGATDYIGYNDYAVYGTLSGDGVEVERLVTALVCGGFLTLRPRNLGDSSYPSCTIPVGVARMLLDVWGHTYTVPVFRGANNTPVPTPMGVDSTVVFKAALLNPEGALAAVYRVGGVDALRVLLGYPQVERNAAP